MMAEINESNCSFTLEQLAHLNIAQLRNFAVFFKISLNLTKPQFKIALRVYATDFNEDEEDTVITFPSHETSAAEGTNNFTFAEQMEMLKYQRESQRESADHSAALQREADERASTIQREADERSATLQREAEDRDH